jgi:atypical dual specificity phosphatase
MWEWTLNWNEVRSDLLIGSCPMSAEDIGRIREQCGATAVMSLQSDACRRAFGIDWEELRAFGDLSHMAVVNAPMLDFDPPDQRRNLPRAIACLGDLLAAGHRVYLHCTAGCNRAPLTALGYFTFVEMQSTDDAMSLLTRARPQSAPSWEAYNGCRGDLVEVLRDNIMVRAYYLSQQSPESDSQAHWVQAEAETIRAAFLNGRAVPRVRLDPNRA